MMAQLRILLTAHFPAVVRFAKRSKLAIILYTMYSDWRFRRQLRSGRVPTSSGALHRRLTLSQHVSYIHRVFDEYIKYSGTSLDVLAGKRILEIGPGDNLGVALMFLAAGAAQVVCVDKFYPKRDRQREYALYRALGETLPEGHRQFIETVTCLRDNYPPDFRRPLVTLYGVSIGEAARLVEPASFDFIVSRSVMEHIDDSDGAFATMDRLLRPGGLMIHTVDFRDHGLFTDGGFHPLTFLTIPDAIYRLMTAHSGRPNRRLLDYYQRTIERLQYQTKILITRVVGSPDSLPSYKDRLTPGVDYDHRTVAMLADIRPKLRPPFRDLPDEQLLVAGIFLTAKKPGDGTVPPPLFCQPHPA